MLYTSQMNKITSEEKKTQTDCKLIYKGVLYEDFKKKV